jgi:transcriptional regulator with XRE-family HTH domain
VLSPEQLDTLRRAPVTGPNKLALAMVLANVRQEQIVQGTRITQGYISKIKNGRYEEVKDEFKQALADFFGCTKDDLFPARQAAVA